MLLKEKLNVKSQLNISFPLSRKIFRFEVYVFEVFFRVVYRIIGDHTFFKQTNFVSQLIKSHLLSSHFPSIDSIYTNYRPTFVLQHLCKLLNRISVARYV